MVCRCYKPWNLDNRVSYYVREAGFGGISEVAGIRLYPSLIQALVERWRRETHTFHFPMGEMTVTLQDVAMLLGLPIDGMAVTYNQILSTNNLAEKFEQLLGVVPPPIITVKANGEQKVDSSLKSISLTWLRETYSNPLPDNATDETVRQHARAYILYVIGGVILPTLQGALFSSMYLPLLENFDDIRRYSWGSACLARLYAGLCSACAMISSNMGGCALLLQLWSWEHFHVGRPSMELREDIYNKSLGCYWKGPKTFRRNPRSCLEFYRDEFDLQEYNQVIWAPYTQDRVFGADPICTEAIDIWLACVPLIQFHEVEWHRPDRVMRQFGFNTQHIPSDIDMDEDKYHGQSRRGWITQPWATKFSKEIMMWNSRRAHVVPLPLPPHSFEDYFNWYWSITRRYMSCPRTRVQREEQAYFGDLVYHPRGNQNRAMLAGLIRGVVKAINASHKYNDQGSREWLEEMKNLFTLIGEPEIYTRILEQMQPFHDSDSD